MQNLLFLIIAYSILRKTPNATYISILFTIKLFHFVIVLIQLLAVTSNNDIFMSCYYDIMLLWKMLTSPFCYSKNKLKIALELYVIAVFCPRGKSLSSRILED